MVDLATPPAERLRLLVLNRPDAYQPGDWMDENKDLLVEMIAAEGPQATGKLLDMPLTTFMSWKKRRGLTTSREFKVKRLPRQKAPAPLGAPPAALGASHTLDYWQGRAEALELVLRLGARKEV